MATTASSPSASRPKEQWREQFRAYRQSLSPPSYRARSALICSHALAHPSVARARTAHVYWPLPDQGELDTRPLIRALRGLDTELVLPVVTSYDPSAPTMEHRRYRGPSAMAPNRWGIPEPTDTEQVPPSALDVVLVPALGVDREGNRIGHGAGYYDHFLQNVDAPRIVLVYEACVVSSVPSDPHDVPATALISEQGLIRC